MRKSTLAIILMLGVCTERLSAITTTLEYEDQREVASRAAISNEIDAAIAALPPSEPPGNYAAVSNAAMNALSRAEAEAGFTRWELSGIPDGATNIQGPEFENGGGGLWCHLGFTYNGVEYNSWPFVDSESVTSVEFDCSDDLDTTSYPVTATRTRLPTMADIAAATNGIPRITESEDYEGWAANAERAAMADEAEYSTVAQSADEAEYAWILSDGNDKRNATDIFSQLDAATATNAAQQAALAGKASTNDVQLTSVYGGNGDRLGDWVVDNSEVYVEWNVANSCWYFVKYDTSEMPFAFQADAPNCWDVNATSIAYHDEIDATATRTENPVIGYTLGDQTDKPIASTNALAAVRAIADAATATNAAQQAALSTHASQLSQQSQSISTLGSQVSAIGAHLNAEDARFVSTNYNSATHMPEAYVEVKITENGVSSWLTVWREMTRWDWFLGVYTNQYAAQTAALATKGEKEYAFYDGVTGEPAPDGFFWIAQPRVAVAAGMSYQRYVDTGGAVWVLESNGMVADVNGTTNGYFRISDDEGNTQFEIVKGSSRTVAAVPGAMSRTTVVGVSHWHTTYAVTNAASAPVAMFCRDIGSPEWHAETDGDCPCNVSWTNPEAGVYVCEWWAKGTEPSMFMKAEYGQGTESRIVQSAPVEMQYIVVNGVKYTLGTATISGSTVLTLTPVSP